MEDSWIFIDDEDDSQHNSASDSDLIDSETEAELYSTIHYEENLNSNNLDSVNFITSKLFVQDGSSSVSTPSKIVFCTVGEKEHVNTHLMDTLKSSSNNLACTEKNETSPKRKIFLNNEFEEDLSPSKKLKSDSVQEAGSVSLCSDNSKHKDINELFNNTSLNHVQSNLSSHAVQFHQKKNDTIDSSDSDSILWDKEEDSSGKTNFETNLMKDVDVIYLSSSDSDNEWHVSPSSKRESILKNLSMPNIKIGENREGLWHINNEDLYRQRKYSRRYHENIDVTCSNCNKKGHNFRTCPVPKKLICFICGDAHPASRCMNRICSNCYSYGHDRKRCHMRPNNFYCTLCSVRGHIKESCPDLWRRYHLTTKPVKIIRGKKIKQDRNLYCWNCGGCGHFGAVCNYRYSGSLTTWPCVVSYDDPHKLLNKQLDDGRSLNDRPRFEPLNGSHNSPRRKKGTKLKQKNKLKQNNKLNQKNKLNASDSVEESERKKRIEKRRDKKMQMRIMKLQEILGERDFPRTPKQEISRQIPNNSEVPESVELITRKQMKNKLRNLKRRVKRHNKKRGVNTQNLQVVM